MTIDEILHQLLQYEAKHVADPFKTKFTEAVSEAIPALRGCKETHGFKEDPACPKCANTLYIWAENDGDIFPMGRCDKCSKSFGLDALFKPSWEKT